MNRKIFLLIILTVLVYSCSTVMEDPDPPVQPRWVEKTLPEAWTEKGIDAESNGIILMWRANHETDLAGYRICRADTVKDNDYIEIAQIDLIHSYGSDTSYIDEQVAAYVPYYYVLYAYDNADNASPASDTISYMLLSEPNIIGPVNETVNGPLQFQWLDRASHFVYSNEFVIRVQRQTEQSFVTAWVCRFTNIWFGYENETPIDFPFLNPLVTEFPSNVLYCKVDTSQLRSGNFRWKIKAISSVDNETGCDEASAESNWGFFVWNP